MSYPCLADLAFEPQLTVLIVLTLLAATFFNRVPMALKWLLGFFIVVCLFPSDPLASALGTVVASVLGSLLSLGLVVMGLRMIVFGGRRHCSRCDCDRVHCRCCRRW